MTAKKPFGLPSVKLVLLAAVAGVVAGAAAVYVKEAGMAMASVNWHRLDSARRRRIALRL